MKAIAQIERLESKKCEQIIVRNLRRILVIRILEVDLENKTLSFAFENMAAFIEVKKELLRIGYPYKKLLNKETLRELSI